VEFYEENIEDRSKNFHLKNTEVLENSKSIINPHQEHKQPNEADVVTITDNNQNNRNTANQFKKPLEKNPTVNPHDPLDKSFGKNKRSRPINDKIEIRRHEEMKNDTDSDNNSRK
jgi:hypothetical protein